MGRASSLERDRRWAVADEGREERVRLPGELGGEGEETGGEDVGA